MEIWKHRSDPKSYNYKCSCATTHGPCVPCQCRCHGRALEELRDFELNRSEKNLLYQCLTSELDLLYEIRNKSPHECCKCTKILILNLEARLTDQLSN